MRLLAWWPWTRSLSIPQLFCKHDGGRWVDAAEHTQAFWRERFHSGQSFFLSNIHILFQTEGCGYSSLTDNTGCLHYNCYRHKAHIYICCFYLLLFWGINEEVSRVWWTVKSEQFEDHFSFSHIHSCETKTFTGKKHTAALFNCFSVVRLHLWDRGGVDTRCVIESTFPWERKVPAVMATSTGVCVIVLVCGHHPRELVSCCFMQEITQLNQATGSGAADAVESHTTNLTPPHTPLLLHPISPVTWHSMPREHRHTLHIQVSTASLMCRPIHVA